MSTLIYTTIAPGPSGSKYNSNIVEPTCLQYNIQGQISAPISAQGAKNKNPEINFKSTSNR